MKVLLVNPPHSFSADNPLGGAGLCLPPLGLLSVAAWLRKEMPGAEIKALDLPASRMSGEEFGREVAAFGPHLAGISVYSGTFSASAAAAAAVRKACPECFIAAGGHHATSRPGQCLARGFDAAIVGEGEKPFSALARALAAGEKPAGLPGVALEPDKKTGRPRPIAPDLLPFPARDLVDNSVYRPSIFAYRRRPVYSVVTSRGCPYSCGFCSKAVFGSDYRAQSPGRVMAELEDLVLHHGAREISFQDDTFTVRRDRVLAICSMMRERGLDLTWSCMTRVDLVDPELLSAMRAAGCFSIAFGIDGAGDAACGLMNKGFDTGRAKKAVAAARSAGIETRGYYIFGYPGETPETLGRSLDRVREVDTDHVFFAFAHPFPDTPLYRKAEREGLLAVSEEELLDSHDNTEPLLKVPGASRAELARFCRKAYLRYYLRPRILRRLLRSPGGVPDFFKALGYFVRWY